MQIESDLVVKLGDAEIVFDEPELTDLSLIIAMDGKPVEEQCDIFLPKVKAVRNLFYRNGTEVTLDDLKAKKFPARFFVQLKTAWLNGISASIKGEAEGKNE